MPRVTLTDRLLRAKKVAPKGQRLEFADAVVPGLRLRITDTGAKSFVLLARYPAKPKNPTRRLLGEIYLPPEGVEPAVRAGNDLLGTGPWCLVEAREKARIWLTWISRGIDPAVEERRLTEASRPVASETFGDLCDEFLKRCAKGWAKYAEAKAMLEADFCRAAQWKDRQAKDIKTEDVARAIRAIVPRGTYAAHNAFGYVRRLFNWAIGSSEFGITANPTANLRPNDLIGPKEVRDRILSRDELRIVWAAATGTYTPPKEGQTRVRYNKPPPELGYPFGPIVRLLILTGQREREVGGMMWSEVDFENRLWTIPASRMKSKRAHEVPLAPDTLALLKSLPRFDGDHVFTTTGGEKSVGGYSKAKTRLDKLSKVTDWKFHDLRRTMRTHLSALPVEDLVRELVIAHAKPGLHKVYDQHSYQDEKLECLTLWEQRLRGILAPRPPAEVADLEQARAAREVAA
jgi:integrase